MSWFAAFIVVIGLERVAELIVSKRHAAWAFSRGGREYGAAHYPAMVVLHSALLVGALLEVWLLGRPFVPVLGWSMVVVVLLTQALRWWCIRTLGTFWNTRVIVVPGASLVTRGPYRLLPHPNYVAVVLEGVALPLVHTAWLTALTFSVLNAALLAVRIRVEDAALGRGRAPA